MHRAFLFLGAVYAFLAVAAGAFGAHALQGLLAPTELATFETGARYQLAHGLALVAVGLAAARWPGARWSLPGWLIAAGTLLFSGSLYALALSGLAWPGLLTPLGGACLLAGWAAAAAAALRSTP